MTLEVSIDVAVNPNPTAEIYKNLDEILEPVRNIPYEFNQMNKFKLLDLGGHGDCFLRCFNFIYSQKYGISFSVEDYYDLLSIFHPNLKTYDYIDHQHIETLLNVFSKNLNLFTYSEKSLDAITIRTSPSKNDDIGSIFCFFPHHFYVVKDLKTELELNSQNFPILGSIPADEDNPRDMYSLPPMNLSDYADYNTIYTYFNNSKLFNINSEEQAIEMFEISQNRFLEESARIENLGKTYNSCIMKSYYKFRHNIYSFIFLRSIGVSINFIETDKPFPLINSEKTPDFILEDQNLNYNYVLEFSVTGDSGRFTYHKGGGIDAEKYSEEIKQLNLVSEKQYRLVMIPLYLNMNEENDFDALVNNTELKILKKNYLKRFLNLARSRIRDINSLSHVFDESVDKLNAEALEVRAAYKEFLNKGHLAKELEVLSIDMEIYSFFYDNIRRINEVLNRKNIKKEKKVLLTLNLDNMKFKFLKGFIERSDYVNWINSKDIKSIMVNTNYLKENRKTYFKDLKGNMLITIPKKMRNFSKDIFEKEGIIMEFYAMDKVINPDKYTQEDVKFDELLDLKDNLIRYKFEDNYYAELIKNLDHEIILKNDKNKKMLANSEVDESHVKRALTNFENEIMKSNSSFVFKVKPLSVYPIPTGLLLSYKTDQNILTYLSKINLGGYTNFVLNKASKGLYCKNTFRLLDDKTVKSRDEMNDQRRNINYLLRQKNVDVTLKEKDIISSFPEFKLEFDKYKFLAKAHKANLRTLTSSVRDRLVSASYGKKSHLGVQFKEEMAHFGPQPGTQYGVGNNYSQQHIKDIDNLLFWFLNSKGSVVDNKDFYSKDRGPGPKFLTDLKNAYTKRWDSFLEKYGKSNICSLTTFISRLCFTLFKESTYTYNKNYCKIDNLGYGNVIILIKGGCKLYKNEKSKLFRAIFPVDKKFSTVLGFENSNYTNLTLDNVNYTATPWMQLHQDTLTDGITINKRFFNYSYTYSTRCDTSFEDFDKQMLLPMLLGISNKRKIEAYMHNSRYLIVNPLGTFSNVEDITKVFSGFNYNFLDCYLRDTMGKNYVNFCINIKKFRDYTGKDVKLGLKDCEVFNIFTSERIADINKLTLMIYSTYLMTKAPVNAAISQSVNLFGILESVEVYNAKHPEVNKMNDESQHIDSFSNDSSCYLDDFKYDPKLCQYKGFYLSNYILQHTNRNEIKAEWDNILEKDIDNMANPNGLRGYKEKNFFNKKGYEVIYDYVLDQLDGEKVLKDLFDEIQVLHNNLSKVDLVKKSKNTFRNMLFETKLEQMIFHIVHKIQRGGDREIFCMDIFTKLFQNPLEKMFAFLCKKVPNEYISVNSSYRNHKIHSSYFEKKMGDWVRHTLNWVLDCRRWGPHMVFQKYVHFVHGMSSILPESFLTYFYYVSDKMFEKKFIFKENIWNKVKNNKRLDNSKGNIRDFKWAKAKEFKISFSFVMGIWNYLSSLDHAGSQLLISEVVRDYCLSKDLGLVNLDIKAHSDDSAGTSQHEKTESIKPSVIIYDWLQKCNGHMLSVKKSQVGPKYFEFLSVLYMSGRLIPVVPKFIGTLPFSPTDKGFSSDIGFCISQAIEILTYGGTFEESFLLLKTSESHIKKLYGIVDNSVDLPYSFCGQIDSHPMELLISGGDSEMLKHFIFNEDKLLRSLTVLKNKNIIDIENIGSFNINWDMGSRVSQSLNEKYQNLTIPEDLGQSWFIKNAKSPSSYFNLSWFKSKLNDKSYYSSLINEPGNKRLARIYGAFAHRSIITKDGLKISTNEIFTALEVSVQTIDHYDQEIFKNVKNFMSQVCFELINFWESIKDVDFEPNLIKHDFTYKPISIKPMSISLPKSIKINPIQYVVYKKEPRFFYLFGLSSDPSKKVKILDGFLDSDSLSPDHLLMIVRKLIGKDKIERRMISCVNSENRLIEGFENLSILLSQNSFSNNRFVMNLKYPRILDYKINYSKFNMPNEVLDFLKMKSAYNFIQSHDYFKLNIFIDNWQETMGNIWNSLSSEWKSLIKSTLPESFEYGSSFYWKFWLNPQKRRLGKWSGLGTLIIVLPDISLRIELRNSEIISIKGNNLILNYFDQASSMYLFNVLVTELDLRTSLITNSESVSTNLYLGNSKRNNCWGIGESIYFDEMFPIEIDANCIPDFLDDCDNYRILNNREIKLRDDRQKEYKLELFFDSINTRLISLGDYIEKEKLIGKKMDKDLISFFSRIGENLHVETNFNKQSLFENFVSTNLYKSFYEYSNMNQSILLYPERQSNIVPMFLEAKERDANIGFPSKSEIADYYTDPDIAELPFSLLQIAESLGKKVLSKKERIYIRNRFKLAADSEKAKRDLQIVYGGTIAGQMVMDMSLKNNDLLKRCKFLDEESLISIFKDLFGFIISMLKERSLRSEWLESISLTVEPKCPSWKMFEVLLCKFVMISRCTVYPLGNSYFITESLITIFKQFVDDDLMEKLDEMDVSGYLRSTSFSHETDFDENKKIFLDFIYDLFDSLVNLNKKFPKNNEEIKDLVAPFTNAVYVINLRKNDLRNEQLEFFDGSNYTKINHLQKKPGKVLGDKIFLDEDDEETFLEEIMFDWEEGEEEVEGISEGPFISKGWEFEKMQELQEQRGTASVLLIQVDRKPINKGDDILTYYERVPDKNLYKLVNSLSTKLVAFSRGRFQNKIWNYSLCSAARRNKLQSAFYKDNGFMLDNIYYKKSEKWTKLELAQRFKELNYNRRLLSREESESHSQEVYKAISELKILEKEKRTKEQDQLVDKFKSVIKKLEKHETSNDFTNLVNKILETLNMDDFTGLLKGLDNEIEDLNVDPWFTKKLKKALFKQDLQPLYDPVIVAEMNTVSQNLVSQIFTKNNKITKENKRRFFSQINSYMKKPDKNESRKAFGMFMKMVLNEFDIVEESHLESKEMLYDIMINFLDKEEEFVDTRAPIPIPDIDKSLKININDMLDRF